MGSRAAPRLAVQPAPGRPRPGYRRLRHARQDVQGADRRAADLADFERLLALEERRDSNTVYVRPELVAEIAFDGVQRSPRYPGGLALRFARVLRYREDKTAADADTIDTVRALSPE